MAARGAGRAAAGGTPTPDVLARRLLGVGGRYTDDELLDALNRAASGLGANGLTVEGYVRWTRTAPPAAGRTPRSVKPFRDRWGSWHAAVEAALRDDRYDGPPHSRNWGRRYTWEEMLHALQDAQEAVGETAYGVYDSWAREQAARGVRRPRASTISRHFGSWSSALESAGLLDDETRARRHARSGTPLTDEQLVDWLIAARSQFGHALTRQTYAAWRSRLIERRPRSAPVPPSDATIRLRLGGWRAALVLADRARARGDAADDHVVVA